MQKIKDIVLTSWTVFRLFVSFPFFILSSILIRVSNFISGYTFSVSEKVKEY